MKRREFLAMSGAFVIFLFHGGCHGCTMQEVNGVDFCIDCQFFDSDWNLPSLNNKPPTPAEIKKEELKKKYSMGEK